VLSLALWPPVASLDKTMLAMSNCQLGRLDDGRVAEANARSRKKRTEAPVV
jgi:hypothetical protein